MKPSKKYISALTALLCIGLLALFFLVKKGKAEQKDYDLEQIVKSGQLRVVTTADSLGFNMSKPGNEGFNYEVLNHLASHLEMELVITTTNNMDSAVQGVLNKDFDLIAMLLPNTTEVNTKVSLTQPFFTSQQVLVQSSKQDSLANNLLITEQLMLANKEIYIPKGSLFKMRIENLSDEIAEPIHIIEVENKSTEALVKEVSEGLISYTICDKMQAAKLKKQFPNIDIALPIGFQQEMCWGVNNNAKKFQKTIREFLSDFLISKEYLEIYRKYY